jgi:hypothetical protein
MDTVLLAGVGFNVIIVGLAVGGYGTRMLRALLPHGPVETLAFSTAIATYLTTRASGELSARIFALRTGLCLLMLAASALLETGLVP